MSQLNIKGISKEKLLLAITDGEALAFKLEKAEKRKRKAVKVGWYVFAYPIIIGVLLFLWNKAGLSIPFSFMEGIIGFISGWVLLALYQIPKITFKVNQQQKKKRQIEQEFVKLTGMHRKLCNTTKLTFMRQALEKGEAANYQNALDWADRKYHQLLVQSEIEYSDRIKR